MFRRWKRIVDDRHQAATDRKELALPPLSPGTEVDPRRIATAAVVGLLLMSCSTPPTQYHDVVQHPYEVRESVTTLDLTDPAHAAGAAAEFAAARPNNGSTFIVTADGPTAQRVRMSVIASGVRPADIRVISAARPVSVERRDHVATVAGCMGGPQSMFGIGSIDDGYGHDNANSTLLGCAVRRNIAAMTDDPRTLVAATPSDGRDGARAAAVYDNWTHGAATAAKIPLPSPRTANTGAEGGGSGGGQ